MHPLPGKQATAHGKLLPLQRLGSLCLLRFALRSILQYITQLICTSCACALFQPVAEGLLEQRHKV